MAGCGLYYVETEQLLSAERGCQMLFIVGEAIKS